MPGGPRLSLDKLMRLVRRFGRLLGLPGWDVCLELLPDPRGRSRKDEVVWVKSVSRVGELPIGVSLPALTRAFAGTCLTRRKKTYPKYRQGHPLYMTSARLPVAFFSFFWPLPWGVVLWFGADEPPKRYRFSCTSLCRWIEHGGHTHE